MKVMKKSPGLGIWRVVAHEVPGAGEDLLQLELVDVLVGEDAAVDGAVLEVDEQLRMSLARLRSRATGLPPLLTALRNIVLPV